MVGQGLARFESFAVLVFGKDGHERLGKRAFGKQAAQQVGQAESNDKGVSGNPGAKSASDHKVADKAQDAGQQRHAAHRGQGLE